MPKVRIPTPLRKLTNELEVIDAAGSTVAEVLDSSTTRTFGFLRNLQRR